MVLVIVKNKILWATLILSTLLAACEESPVEKQARILKAAQQGNAAAQYNLGVALSTGDEKDRDYPQAVVWYRKAAEQGVVEAAYNLGVIYKYGAVGVEQGDSCSWFKQAAEKEHPQAMYEFGGCVKGNAHVTWLKRAVDKGVADAASSLGVDYLYGKQGLEQDKETGVRWFMKGADMGSAIAMNNLATSYSLGIFLQKDPKKAFDWYLKSAKMGYCGAFSAVGNSYEFGVGVDHDPTKALEFYQKGAEHGDAHALSRLAKIYENGELGMQQDHGKAKQVRAVKPTCQT